MRIYSNILAFIIAILIILRTTLLAPWLSGAYYVVIISGAVLVTLTDLFYGELKINYKVVLFLLACVLSIIFNEINPVFRPWDRFMGFAALLILLGPVSNGRNSIILKNKVFDHLRYLLIIFTVLSFVAYIFRLPLAFNFGHFGGLAWHSMTLAPMAAMATILCLDSCMNIKGRSNIIFYVILSIICLVVVFLSASRGAIGALLIAMVIFLYFKYNRKKVAMIRVLFTVSLILGFIIIYNPGGVLDSTITKIEARDADDFTSGRDEMWKDRITDFEYSPIIGVGFSSMRATDNSIVDLTEGGVEPGSGWLMVLSSTGLLGMITFLLLLILPLIRIHKKYTEYSMYGALIIFFAVHTTVEGYTMAFGSSLCALMWLIIGLSNSLGKSYIIRDNL